MKYFWLGSLGALFVGACSTPPAKQASTPIYTRWVRDPETLDPLALPNPSAVDAANLMHLALLQVDYQQNKYTPALAEALPEIRFQSDSLTLATYQLRPAATWDDGSPVLATDVDFTLKLMNCPGLPNENSRVQFNFIRQVRLDSTNPRRFTLVCRSRSAEVATTSGDFSVLPEASFDPAHTLRKLPLATLQDWPATRAPDPSVAALVQRYQRANLARQPNNLPGCGPYRLVSWETDHELHFQRKAHWWADKLPNPPFVLQAHPQELAFTILPDDAAAALALRRHDIDIYPQVPVRIFQQLQASAGAREELAFYSKSSYDVLTVGFNTRRPLLHDRRTRQALGYLFDPARLLTATQLGQGTRTVGLLPPSSPFYNDSLPLPSYAPDKATALLNQAGWQRGTDGHWRQPGSATALAVAVRYRAEDNTFATVGLQFQAAAAQLGIPVTLVPSENSVINTSLQAGDFDLYIRPIKGSPFGLNFATILHSKAIGLGNFTGFGTPLTDRLLTEIATEGNLPRKRRLLRRFQVMLQQEMPLLPLFFLPYRLAASRQLQHVITSGIKPGYAVAALSWPAAEALPATSH
jgi:ABC-type transport system substrate-binding protein